MNCLTETTEERNKRVRKARLLQQQLSREFMYTKGLERHLLLDTKCHFDVKFISKTTRLFEMKIVLHSFLGKHLKNKRKIRLSLKVFYNVISYPISECYFGGDTLRHCPHGPKKVRHNEKGLHFFLQGLCQLKAVFVGH